MKLLALPLLALALGGCAMTPHQQDQFRANFMNGLAGAAMIEQSRRPMYQPMPIRQSTQCTTRWSYGVAHTDCW